MKFYKTKKIRRKSCLAKRYTKKRKSKKNKKGKRKNKNYKGGGIFGLPDISFKYTFSQGLTYPRNQCPPHDFKANEFLQGYNNNL